MKTNKNLLLTISQSPAAFTHHMGTIISPQSKQKFIHNPNGILWNWQYKLLELIHNSPKHIAIMKSRQIGITSLLCHYATWLAIFQPGSRIALISYRQEESTSLLDRIYTILQFLPPNLKPHFKKTTFKIIIHKQKFSTIQSFPASPNPSSGYENTLVIWDEVSKHPYPDQAFASLEPTINTGGKLILSSTAVDPSGWFEKLYYDIKQNLKPGWKAIFLPYILRPERTSDPSWWDKTVAQYPSEYLARREYPLTIQDIYTTPIGHAFPPEILSTPTSKPIPLNKLPNIPKSIANLHPNLKIFKPPNPELSYSKGLDVSSGSSKDFSAMSIICLQTGEQVAELNIKIDIHSLTDIVESLSTLYPGPLIIERNGLGIAIIDALSQRNHPFLAKPLYVQSNSSHPVGFVTTRKSKQELINHLISCWINHSFIPNSQELIQQAKNFERKSDGSVSSTRNDDLVIATALACSNIKNIHHPKISPSYTLNIPKPTITLESWMNSSHKIPKLPMATTLELP